MSVGNDINEFCEWENGIATHENIYNAQSFFIEVLRGDTTEVWDWF